MANRNFLLQVLISAKDQASATFKNMGTSVKGLFGGFTELLSALRLAEGAFRSLGEVYQNTVGVAVEYAKAVRQLAQVTGMGADEASRMIQVAEDWGISAQQLQTGLAMLAKNGIAPTIENIAQLADEFVNNYDAADRAAKMSQAFGRQWQTLVPLLAKGGEALRDQAGAVEESLVLTPKAIEQARAYEMALDNLEDAVMGVKVSIGTGLLPIITEALIPGQKELVGETEFIVKVIGDETKAFILLNGHMKEATLLYWELKAAAEGSAASFDRAAWALKEYEGTVRKTIPIVDELAEKEKELEAAARKTADVYRMAEEALRESNIAMDKKIELEEKIRLMSGDVTQEELDLEDAIGAITTALGRDYITRDQYLQWLLALAIGASTAKDIVDALTAALLRIPKAINTTIDIRYRVHGGPNPVSEPGPDAPYNPPGPPGWDTYEPGDTMTMAPTGLGGKTAPMGSPSVVINQFLGPGLDENTLATLTAAEVTSAVAEATRAADNGGLRYAG